MSRLKLNEISIVDCLTTDYGIAVTALTLLPIGADMHASVYKAETREGSSYFIKLKRGHHYDISVTILALLQASGIQRIIPPIKTIHGEHTQRIDGHDIQKLTLKSLRKNIGLVQQDVYLFAGTVLENIRYGKPDATEEEIITAAKQANALDFITRLPNGYSTEIGQRGVKLSGGQKQRLSIARVFLKNPPILIFDEATSSLDNESERAVQDSLERLMKNRTTLVIAHRLSTIRNAQRILVLTDNGIEEQGTHEELIALDGAYAKLYNIQLRIE